MAWNHCDLLLIVTGVEHNLEPWQSILTVKDVELGSDTRFRSMTICGVGGGGRGGGPAHV